MFSLGSCLCWSSSSRLSLGGSTYSPCSNRLPIHAPLLCQDGVAVPSSHGSAYSRFRSQASLKINIGTHVSRCICISEPLYHTSRKVTSQPANQPTSQPASQPANQPTSQPTSQPANQPANQPTNQPTSQPASQPTSQPASKITNSNHKNAPIQ